jgi:hypothetical protein
MTAPHPSLFYDIGIFLLGVAFITPVAYALIQAIITFVADLCG